jgi:alpha-tubulin suppressor-like RCC1 family protein
MGNRFRKVTLAVSLMLLITGSEATAALAGHPRTAGVVFAWGSGGHGQLGVGKVYLKGCSCVARPMRVTGVSNVVRVATGLRFSVALRKDGTLWTWGSNDFGQLGQGFISKRGCVCALAPRKVLGLKHIVAISVAQSFVLALKRNGSVWAWGSNSYGELGTGVNPFGEKGCICKDRPFHVRSLPPAVAISAGTGNFSLALDRHGHVWAWGENMTGQLGLHITDTETCLCEAGPTKVGGLPPIREVSAGGGFSAAVDRTGNVWVWGVNDQSQLAQPATRSGICACIDFPIRVRGVPAATAVSAGAAFTLVLTAGGRLWGWGANYEGVLAAGKTAGLISRPLPGARSYSFAQVTTGGSTGMGITRAGELLAWGRDTTGQFGRGTVLSRGCGCSRQPVEVMSVVRSVSIGPGFVLVVR